VGRVAAAVLASLLAVGGRAQEFKASVPATKDTPAFSVQLNERPAGQCLGNGFDQEAIIDLQGHDLSRIVVQDNCANEGNGIERLVLYKNGEACECPEYRTFAQNIFLAARTAAWEQNKEHYAQLLIAQLKTAEPSVGKAKIYITSTKYVPEGDVAHLSYVELPEGNAIIFYTYTYVPQGGRARVYIDKPPYGSLDLAAEQTDSSLEKAFATCILLAPRQSSHLEYGHIHRHDHKTDGNTKKDHQHGLKH